MQYTLSIPNPSSRYLHIEAVASQIQSPLVRIQLPAWRPGRYELGNFAKNVRDFRVTDSKGNALSYSKITKDCWEVVTNGATEIRIVYAYFSNELNAGSTFVDEEQVYVNPVNCLVYLTDRLNENCRVDLNVPENWKLACSLKKENKHSLLAPNFDTLADSPFICSPSLKHNMFVLDGVEFHLWFQGECKPDWSRIVTDSFIYISEIMTIFRSAPCEEYHFLYQILPQRFYHGVEHTHSTVIALGPAHKLMTEVYGDFLGVSCHELFHAWNIKAIRPAEMVPYDFTKENYSRLGYVCEGVTTYYGDYLLMRSGVWREEEFWPTFEERLEKHFETHARYFYSVAESSFDTWLDGYAAGAPHRKTSIYHEGCLLAFVTDQFIRLHSKGKKKLDDVMRRLWEEFAKKGNGYTEADYKRLVEEEADADFSYYWNNYFYKAASYETIVSEALERIGYELIFTAAKKVNEDYYGFKVAEPGGATKVTEIYYGSPADKAGLTIGDDVIAINNMHVKADLAEWMLYYGKTTVELLVVSSGKMKQLNLVPDDQHWYQRPRVVKQNKPNQEQVEAFARWAGKKTDANFTV
jgi:predicted metalloprotease with PDZ domain